MKVILDSQTGEYVIRIPANPQPKPSKQGKMLLLASSGGFTPTTHEHEGHTVKASVILGFTPAA